MDTAYILISKSEFKYFKRAWRILNPKNSYIPVTIIKIERFDIPTHVWIHIQTKNPAFYFNLGKLMAMFQYN
jgi:hypothetical protein